MIPRITNGKWDDLEDIDKRVTGIESKIRYPPKKRYYLLYGGDNNILVIE